MFCLNVGPSENIVKLDRTLITVNVEKTYHVGGCFNDTPSRFIHLYFLLLFLNDTMTKNHEKFTYAILSDAS